jgi:hypothetical protein
MADNNLALAKQRAQTLADQVRRVGNVENIVYLVRHFINDLDDKFHVLGDGDLAEWYAAAAYRRGKTAEDAAGLGKMHMAALGKRTEAEVAQQKANELVDAAYDLQMSALAKSKKAGQ